MKIVKVDVNEAEFNRVYGCNNCIRQRNPCFGYKRDCRLMVAIADQMTEPDKIDKFVNVLYELHMKVVVVRDGFQIVAV